MPLPPEDPAFWHGRAAEARAAARQMSDPLSRAAMLALAARYERIAAPVVRGDDTFIGAGNREDKCDHLEL